MTISLYNSSGNVSESWRYIGCALSHKLNDRNYPRVYSALPLETDPRMYIDPSAGSLVLQAAAAALLSGVAMFSRVRVGIRDAVASIFRRKTS